MLIRGSSMSGGKQGVGVSLESLMKYDKQTQK